MKAIGPTFTQELNAAGLGGLPFSWHSSGELTLTDPRLTAAQMTAIEAVYAAHDPTKTLPPVANSAGLIVAMQTTVFPDPIRRNTVMRAYPEMMPAIQMQDWPTVTALIQDSLSSMPTGIAITSTEHAALQAAWTANSIPGSCP